MLGLNSQSLKSESFPISEIESSSITKFMLISIKKLTEADIDQLKIYLGLAYFILVSLISITLF